MVQKGTFTAQLNSNWYERHLNFIAGAGIQGQQIDYMYYKRLPEVEAFKARFSLILAKALFLQGEDRADE